MLNLKNKDPDVLMGDLYETDRAYDIQGKNQRIAIGFIFRAVSILVLYVVVVFLTFLVRVILERSSKHEQTCVHRVDWICEEHGRCFGTHFCAS